MANEGPSSAKQTRYLLKSNTRNRLLIEGHNESTDGKRKRKDSLQLMDFCNECLLAIFKNMNVIELCDVSETSKRAQALAQYTFHSKHRRLDLVSLAGPNPKLALRLLRSFGGVASSLNMARNVLFPHKVETASRKLLSLIAKYCRPNTLTELLISEFTITSVSMTELKELFRSLEMLKLENTTIKDFDFSSFNDKLKVLKLYHSDSCTELYLAQVYEKLIKFINRAEALKVLSIHSSEIFVKSHQYLFLMSRVHQAIGELKDLQELELDERCHRNREISFQRNCSYLFVLNNLKVLKINCQGHSVQHLVEGIAANNIAIEHLSLENGRFDKGVSVATAISKLETIKILKLLDMKCVDDPHLLVIAKGLKLLTELVVAGWFSVNVTQQAIVEMLRETDRLSCLKIIARSFKFNIDTYNEMLAIIKNRPEHFKLQLTFGSWFEEPFDPKGYLRSTDKWLSVKEVYPSFIHQM